MVLVYCNVDSEHTMKSDKQLKLHFDCFKIMTIETVKGQSVQ